MIEISVQNFVGGSLIVELFIFFILWFRLDLKEAETLYKRGSQSVYYCKSCQKAQLQLTKQETAACLYCLKEARRLRY